MSAAAGDVKFSVVTPAHDAAQTLAATLDSLIAQTHPHWEAIVVDDGSTDATGEIAAAYAARDARIRVVRQRQAGEGGARNTAVAHSRNDWLLFLDADDWVAEETLARFAAAIAADPALDAVHCGWIHVDPDGRVFGEHRCALTGDLFGALASAAQFPVHACVVRRALVEAAGGFDTTLRSCADWDMWQRVARLGARFGSVSDALAWYRVRPNNTWTGGKQFLTDGLRLVTQGHGEDLRVANPLPVHAHGRPREELAQARLTFVGSPAAMELARGGDAAPFLDSLPDEPAFDLDPEKVASVLFYSAPRSLCRGVDAWSELWPRVEPNLGRFLRALEARSRASGFARRAARAIERLVLEHSISHRPTTVGATHAIEIEVTKPIADVETAGHVERVQCALTIEREPLGMLELPVCEGAVPAAVLADAIAADHAWQILGGFFRHTVYRELKVGNDEAGTTVMRGTTVLAARLERDPRTLLDWAHEAVGWTVFLQEIWGRPAWPRERFFATPEESEPAVTLGATDWIACDVSAELPEVAEVENVSAVLSVGGTAIGVVEVDAVEGRVSADRLRAAFMRAAGMELCRAAVREAVIGRPFSAEPAALRERLAVASAGKAIGAVPVRPLSRRALSRWELSMPAEVVHGWPNPMVAAPAPLRAGVVLSRKPNGAVGTSASRRAALPARSAQVLRESAEAAGELVMRERRRRTERVARVPDLVWRPGRTRWDVFTDGLRSMIALQRPAPEPPPPKRPSAPYLPVGPAERLPILMYHRVAPEGAAATSRWRVAPEKFEQQLAALREAGCYSVSLDAWRQAAWRRQGLQGRPVLLTFDDGYTDFADHAWPLLQRYGFTAVLFVVADRIGGAADWAAMRPEALPLLGWPELRRLAREGVIIGSHSATHPELTGLDPATAVNELARSRAVLSRGLGTPIDTIAYPHGAQDAIVRHLAGACGYTFGFTCEPGTTSFDDGLLALPRIEVRGDMTIDEFRATLGIETASAEPAHD